MKSRAEALFSRGDEDQPKQTKASEPKAEIRMAYDPDDDTERENEDDDQGGRSSPAALMPGKKAADGSRAPKHLGTPREKFDDVALTAGAAWVNYKISLDRIVPSAKTFPQMTGAKIKDYDALLALIADKYGQGEEERYTYTIRKQTGERVTSCTFQVDPDEETRLAYQARIAALAGPAPLPPPVPAPPPPPSAASIFDREEEERARRRAERRREEDEEEDRHRERLAKLKREANEDAIRIEEKAAAAAAALAAQTAAAAARAADLAAIPPPLPASRIEPAAPVGLPPAVQAQIDAMAAQMAQATAAVAAWADAQRQRDERERQEAEKKREREEREREIADARRMALEEARAEFAKMSAVQQAELTAAKAAAAAASAQIEAIKPVVAAAAAPAPAATTAMNPDNLPPLADGWTYIRLGNGSYMPGRIDDGGRVFVPGISPEAGHTAQVAREAAPAQTEDTSIQAQISKYKRMGETLEKVAEGIGWKKPEDVAPAVAEKFPAYQEVMGPDDEVAWRIPIDQVTGKPIFSIGEAIPINVDLMVKYGSSFFGRLTKAIEGAAQAAGQPAPAPVASTEAPAQVTSGSTVPLTGGRASIQDRVHPRTASLPRSFQASRPPGG